MHHLPTASAIRNAALLLVVASALTAEAATQRYRLTWRDDPTTTMVVGWEQISGTDAVVYYDTVDHGENHAAYAFSKNVDRAVTAKGMNHRFARLIGLQPDTAYYFIIRDNDSSSPRYWFKTAPNTPSDFSIIAGGDSRNNRNPRRKANTIVSKIRPLFVAFGGDYTDNNTDAQWAAWFDDWQNVISSDGRFYPVLIARGNHDDNASLQQMFDIPNSSIYFAYTFGGNQLRAYTLNSEITAGGNQGAWLTNDLATLGQTVSFRIAQYHKPMRPHISSKSEGNDEYNNWAQPFYDYGVDLVVECDSHLVKRTFPIRPSSSTGSEQGFVRDDLNGTVYVGEGCWGAPLRSANDGKAWTMAMDSFNQVNWIQVHTGKMEVRTLRVDDSDLAESVNDAAPFAIPNGLSLWTPATGETLVITADNTPNDNNPPAFDAANYTDSATSGQTYTRSFAANASDPDGDSLLFRKVDGPAWLTITANGTASGIPGSGDVGDNNFVIQASDDRGGNATSNLAITVQPGNYNTPTTVSFQVNSSSDDAEERQPDGSIVLTSTDLELVHDSYNSRGDQQVAIRFTNVSIHQGATVTDAYVQFTTDEATAGSASLSIRGLDADNASAFTATAYDVSSRPTTAAAVAWVPMDWPFIADAGEAQQTPNLQTIVQEIVNREGWRAGNAMALVITGTGQRTAESYDGSPTAAPTLYLSYEPPASAPSTVPAVSAADRLAWFELDWNVTDANGNLAMSLVNNAAFSVDAKFGSGALVADAAAAGAAIADAQDFNLGGPWAARTASLWFKLDAVAGRQVVFEEGGGSRGFNVYVDNGNLYVGGWDIKIDHNDLETWPGTWHNLGPIAAGQWHHVAVVLDAAASPAQLTPSAFRAYLDGSQAAAGNGMQMAKHADDAALGTIHGGTRFHDGTSSNSAAFAGTIDDLAIWNRVLADTEIAALADKSTANIAPVASDDAVTTEQNLPLGITLAATDPDGDDNALSYLIVTPPANGNVDGTPPNLTYTPNAGFFGNDFFTFTANDGQADSNLATVSITVNESTPPTASTVTAVSATQRLAWFALDTDLADANGNLSASLLGSAAISADAKFGSGGLSTDTASAGVSIADAQNFNLGGPWSTRSIALWFKLDAVSGRQMVFEEGGSVRGFNFYVDNGSLYVGAWDQRIDGNDAEAWSGTWHNLGPVTAGQWHHVALVLDAAVTPTQLAPDTFRAYLNGNKVASGDGMQISAHSDNAGLATVVGGTRYHDGATKGAAAFTGSIDDLAIWNRALADAEIAVLAGQTASPDESSAP